MLALVFDHHVKVAQHHRLFFFNIRLGKHLSRFKKMVYAPEYPWIPLSAPAHHYCVTARVFQHADGILRRPYVAVPDDGYGNRFLNVPYDVPVRLSAVELLPRPAMHGHRGCPAFLGHSGKFGGIDMLIIPALADLHSNRLRRCRHHSPYNLSGELRFEHERAAVPVFRDLRRGTAHVYVYDSGR